MSLQEISIKDFGAVGDGTVDDSPAIQAALDSGAAVVTIPTGLYRVCTTLRVPSNTAIHAASTAHIKMCGETPWKSGEYLLTNADHENGNENIEICGGVWDGNNTGRCIVKPDIFNLEGYSGTVLNFFHVKGLKLSRLVVANSLSYNIRLSRLSDFVFTDIGFVSEQRVPNQDGLHFGGHVRNGVVKGVYALSKGQTNDDLIALNADDCMWRVESVGKERGDIENIHFEDIFAEDCHTLVRMLSVTSAIRNITMKNLYGGCRCFAVNCDGARHCRSPFFKDEEFPDGTGEISHVRLENVRVHFTSAGRRDALIVMETRMDHLELVNFTRNRELDASPDAPMLLARNLTDTRLTVDGVTHELLQKSDDMRIQSLENLTAERASGKPISKV